MYFFHCEETRPLVSIFTYIDAMLLNLEAPFLSRRKQNLLIYQYSKISEDFKFFKKFQNSKIKKYYNNLKFKISKISKRFHIFIRFQNFPQISKFQDFKNFSLNKISKFSKF